MAIRDLSAKQRIGIVAGVVVVVVAFVVFGFLRSRTGEAKAARADYEAAFSLYEEHLGQWDELVKKAATLNEDCGTNMPNQEGQCAALGWVAEKNEKLSRLERADVKDASADKARELASQVKAADADLAEVLAEYQKDVDNLELNIAHSAKRFRTEQLEPELKRADISLANAKMLLDSNPSGHEAEVATVKRIKPRLEKLVADTRARFDEITPTEGIDILTSLSNDQIELSNAIGAITRPNVSTGS